MHVQQVLRAGPVVQVINILGHQRHRAGMLLLQQGKSKVRGIGLDARLLQLVTTLVVKTLHQRRIAGKGLRRGNILKPMVLPQAVGATKSADARFGGNAGASQDDNIHANP